MSGLTAVTLHGVAVQLLCVQRFGRVGVQEALHFQGAPEKGPLATQGRHYFFTSQGFEEMQQKIEEMDIYIVCPSSG